MDDLDRIKANVDGAVYNLGIVINIIDTDWGANIPNISINITDKNEIVDNPGKT